MALSKLQVIARCVLIGESMCKQRLINNTVQLQQRTLLTTTHLLSSSSPPPPHVSFNKKDNVHTTKKYSKATKPSVDYSSESDAETMGHRGESEFWRRKMRTVHGILDVNKDGVISYDDFQLLADRFIGLGNLADQQKKDFRNTLQDLWEKQWGPITPYNLVTVEQYLENMHHVLNDRLQSQKVHSFLPYLFKAVDKDQSGEISLDEFKNFYSCLGLNNADAKTAFMSIDVNEDGKITLKEFVKHGRDFFLTEDKERVSKHFWGPLANDH